MPDLRYAQRGAQRAAQLRTLNERRGYAGNNKLWTEAEDKICRDLHPDYQAILRTLPYRSYYAVRNRCQKLGLAPKRNLVTSADVSKLRRFYSTSKPDELRRLLPGRSLKQIRAIARYYGIRKRRRGFLPTGHPIIDDIRQRCFNLNYSMVELDREAGTGSYFAKGGWHSPNGFSPAKVAKAIVVLDGQIKAEWSSLQ